jgi:pyridoxine 4-dehydrogenase
MIDLNADRRQFLGQAAAVLAAGGALGSAAFAAAGKPVHVVNRKSPAAASGTILLGGDMEVSRMGFGAMRITGEGIWGEPRDAREARAVLRRAVELGVNFIDTADAYGPMVSERLIAEALHPYPRGLIVATKGGMTRSGPNKWAPDCRPAHLREACEGSLKRLKAERIDLYQLHAVDGKVPYADSVGELAKLQQEGKIRHIGVSNVNAEQLQQARSLVKVVSVQNFYNVAVRTSEEVLKICERDGIAFIPWGPLAQRAQASDKPNAALASLRDIAEHRKLEMSQATLVWLLGHSKAMLPIPGTSSLAHLEENVAAARLRFTQDEMQRIG